MILRIYILLYDFKSVNIYIYIIVKSDNVLLLRLPLRSRIHVFSLVIRLICLMMYTCCFYLFLLLSLYASEFKSLLVLHSHGLVSDQSKNASYFFQSKHIFHIILEW